MGDPAGVYGGGPESALSHCYDILENISIDARNSMRLNASCCYKIASLQRSLIDSGVIDYLL